MSPEDGGLSRRPYNTDISDEEWAVLQPMVPKVQSGRGRGGHPEVYPKREIINGIRYILGAGCRWRDLPHDLPPWHTVWHYFHTWSIAGIWKRINTLLRKKLREKLGRTPHPSAGIIDSQTAKNVPCTMQCGYDAGKKTKGRKRHVLTDTLGLVIDVVVHPADIQDRDGARILLRHARRYLRTLLAIFADGGYAGKFIDWVKERFNIAVQVVKRTDQQIPGFVVIPKRWVIERTNGWFSQSRRLCRDYERQPKSEESMIYARMIEIMLRRVV